VKRPTTIRVRIVDRGKKAVNLGCPFFLVWPVAALGSQFCQERNSVIDFTTDFSRNFTESKKGIVDLQSVVFRGPFSVLFPWLRNGESYMKLRSRVQRSGLRPSFGIQLFQVFSTIRLPATHARTPKRAAQPQPVAVVSFSIRPAVFLAGGGAHMGFWVQARTDVISGWGYRNRDRYRYREF